MKYFTLFDLISTRKKRPLTERRRQYKLVKELRNKKIKKVSK